jgi:hypothetical protein
MMGMVSAFLIPGRYLHEIIKIGVMEGVALIRWKSAWGIKGINVATP